MPLEALKACTDGPHRPANPHKQRLLVASNKSAKLRPAAKQKSREPPAASPAASTAPPTDSATQAKAKPWSDTAYGTERKRFLAQILGKYSVLVLVHCRSLVGCIYRWLRCEKGMKQHQKEALWKSSWERQQVLSLFSEQEQRKRRYV